MFKKRFIEGKDDSIYGVVDERTKNIVDKGNAYCGKFMLFAVFMDVFIRGLYPDLPFIASNSDLVAIAIIGGIISTGYQVKHKVIRRTFSPIIAILLFFCAVVAVLTILLGK